MPWREFIVSTNSAPQKVDPALIARFIPTMISCFALIDPTMPPASYELGEGSLGPDDCKAYGPWPRRKHRHQAADLWPISKGPSFGTGRGATSQREGETPRPIENPGRVAPDHP